MSEQKIIELAPFRADLTRALARRGEGLLAAADLAAEVAALEPLEAYYLVKELGLERALPVLVQLNPEQLAVAVDLDCWDRYDFAADRLDEWLTAYALDGAETLARAFSSLDYVVQLLYATRTVTVYDPDLDQIPPPAEEEEPNRAMTPDGMYLLEARNELPLKTHPFAVLDALYQYDAAAAHRLLSDIRVDLPSQIEEEALRFRTGRLQDLGFAAPAEAAVLFSRPDRQKPAPRFRKLPGDDSTRLPALYAATLGETTLLEQALARITDPDELARLEQELVWAINSAIIAYGEKTQALDQIAEIAARVRDTVALGLETLLAEGYPEGAPDGPAAAAKAVELLAHWAITDLFRHGFAATLGLQQAVRQALAEPCFRDWYHLAESSQADTPGDRQERAFVTALRRRHPLRGGFDLARAERVKAFASLAEIDVARVRLKRLRDRLCGQG